MSTSATTRARARVPAGRAQGGRFALEPRTEPQVGLAAADAYGFPTIVCPRCEGTGRSRYSQVARTDRCYHCNGTGRAYEPGLVLQAVRDFATARMAATRPQVRHLREGDLVSMRYEDLGEAQWRKVAGVLVYPNRPSRFAGSGPDRHPIAYEAVVELEDGTAIMAATDTVVARRGTDVDPAPYVARAIAAAVNKPA